MRKHFLILLLFCISAQCLLAQTNGTLAVSATTSSAGGNYSPRNIVAIWVEDSSGKFIKTLLAYAATRKTHLNTWEISTTSAGSAYNVTDAITGATQSTHGTRTCTWNGKDFNGNLVADGTYNLRMELTDKNASGNIASFTFTKGPANQTLSPANVPSFSSISIKWTSGVTGIAPEVTESNAIVVYPNPGNGLFTVLGENIRTIKISNLSGKTILKSNSPVVDLSGQPNGIYLFTVKTSKQTFVEKVIKE
jgi:hypothetical protein